MTTLKTGVCNLTIVLIRWLFYHAHQKIKPKKHFISSSHVWYGLWGGWRKMLFGRMSISEGDVVLNSLNFFLINFLNWRHNLNQFFSRDLNSLDSTSLENTNFFFERFKIPRFFRFFLFIECKLSKFLFAKEILNYKSQKK